MRPGLLALLLLAAGCATASAADNCLKRGDRQAAIASGQAVRLNEALRNLRGTVGGRMVGAALCPGAGGLVYRVRILEPNGSVRTAQIDARTGQVLSLR